MPVGFFLRPVVNEVEEDGSLSSEPDARHSKRQMFVTPLKKTVLCQNRMDDVHRPKLAVF